MKGEQMALLVFLVGLALQLSAIFSSFNCQSLPFHQESFHVLRFFLNDKEILSKFWISCSRHLKFSHELGHRRLAFHQIENRLNSRNSRRSCQCRIRPKNVNQIS